MLFQRIDTGEFVTVRKQVVVIFGEATIEIGGQMVKCRKISDSDRSDASAPPPPVVSDFGLGFPQHELAKKREHVERHGFTGVEFKPDPRVPEFLNVHFSGPEERKRYEKSMGQENISGRNGGQTGFPPGHLERAIERAKEMFSQVS